MVHLIQILCPNRHTMVAAPYDPGKQSAQEALDMLKEAFRQSGLNPWCGLCQSRELCYEDAATIFKSIEEAMPALRAMEQLNLSTRRILKAGSN